jgi:hypothetical protein
MCPGRVADHARCAKDEVTCSIAVFIRPRRAWLWNTVLKASSNTSCMLSGSKESEHSRPSGFYVQAQPLPWSTPAT